MKDTASESHQWTGGGSFINAVESVLLAGREGKPTHSEEWHAAALVFAQQITSANVLQAANRLLNEAPYEDMHQAVEQLRDHDLSALTALRMGRKLFLIARDSIILTTGRHSTDEYTALRQLCASLGRVRDAHGADTASLNLASASLATLEELPRQATSYLHDSHLFRHKIAQCLGSGALLDQPLEECLVTSEQYHQARKNFRRVTNLFALEAARTENAQTVQFAVRGVQLNHHYGAMVDEFDEIGA